MSKFIYVFAAACGLTALPEPGLSTSGLAQAGNSMQDQASSSESQKTDGRLLVKFEAGVSDQEIDTIVHRLGATVVNRMSDGKLLLVEVPYKDTVGQIKAAFEATPGVSYAEPEQIYRIQPETAPPDSGSETPPDATGPSIQGGSQ